jgi:hypothetical protein
MLALLTIVEVTGGFSLAKDALVTFAASFALSLADAPPHAMFLPAESSSHLKLLYPVTVTIGLELAYSPMVSTITLKFCSALAALFCRIGLHAAAELFVVHRVVELLP